MTDPNREVSYVIRAIDGVTSVLQNIEKSALGLFGTIGNLGTAIAGVGTGLAALKIGEIVTDLIDLGVASDKTFRQITASLPTGVAGIADLKNSLNDLAVSSGRSLEDVQGLGLAIAQMGVGSATELKQQAVAATTLSDATGTGLTESAQLLIQLRREFGLTGDQALDTAAKLAETAKGKVPLAELFSVFQASTPTFQRLGIDVDTGTKAIIALVNEGMNLRSVRTALNSLDATGFQELAATAHVASDYMLQFTADAQGVRDSAAAAAQRVRTDFNAALEDLGTKFLPTATAGMQALLGLMSKSYSQAAELKDAFAQLQAPGAAGSTGVSVADQDALATLEKRFNDSEGSTAMFSGETPEQLAAILAKAQELLAVTGQHKVLVVALAAAYQAAEKAAGDAAAKDTAAQDAATKKASDAVQKILAEAKARTEATKAADEQAAKIPRLNEELANLLQAAGRRYLGVGSLRTVDSEVGTGR